MKKSVCLILFAVIWMAACGGNVNSTAGTSEPSAIAPSPLPYSMKGYELYSWQAEDQWHFTLITGTNRQKSIDEITSGEDTAASDGWVRISVQGVDALKSLLSRLPQNEEILWVGKQQFQAGNITLPSQDTIDAIQKLCKQLRLVLNVSE